MGILPHTHEDVFWLNVAMHDAFSVKRFKPSDELQEKHESGLQSEFASTEFE